MAHTFSLQPVLEYRKIVEEKRQLEMKEALDAVARVENEMKELFAGLDQNREAVRRALREGHSLANRLLFENWMNWADQRLKRLEAELRGRRAEAEKRRRTLAEAAKQTTIMEKLKERERKEIQRAADRAELRMFDEIALREFANVRQIQSEKEQEKVSA